MDLLYRSIDYFDYHLSITTASIIGKWLCSETKRCPVSQFKWCAENMEKIFKTDFNLTFKLDQLVSKHWINYEEVSDVFHVLLGILVILVGIVSFTSNGFILWMFYR